MQEFGLRITTPEEQKEILERQRRFTLPEADGSVNVTYGGYYGMYLDMDAQLVNDYDLIIKYREIASQLELDKAINDIVNESIVFNSEGRCVELNLDNVDDKKINKNVKTAIEEEFEKILKLLNFKNKAYEIFRNWYVDGRIYYHVVLDHEKTNLGIVDLEWIDPLKIKKIRKIEKKRDIKSGLELIKSIEDFYIYNETGLMGNQTTAVHSGTRIAPDSIVYVPSGILNSRRTQVLSYLHKAIKPINQLRMVEDAMVIYRISRAPERRLFYIDVGTMSTQKSNQYVRSLQQNFRNKLVYDAQTGEIRDDRKFMSMLEDFWLPRREGGRGTEISTLPGAGNLGDIEDVQYLKTQLYNALNIPVSRMQPDTGFSLGRTTEITRDEITFSKFINRLRKQFSTIFDDLLEKQLVLKGILSSKEWNDIKQDVIYDYNEDNNFDELKDAELLRDRLDILNLIDQHVGKYFTREWVMKNVLRLSDDEIKELLDSMKDENEELVDDPMWQQGMMGAQDPMAMAAMDSARKTRPQQPVAEPDDEQPEDDKQGNEQ